MCNCNNTTPCQPTDCSCKITLSTDCITLSEDLVCSNILKGQTETEVLKQLDAYICERFDSVTNFFTLINVGNGSEIYKGISNLGKKELRTLVDSGLINLVQGTDTITISVDEAALNTFIEANQKTYSALNTGTGSEVHKSSTVVGDNTQFNFRKLKSTDSSVTITQGVDDIDFSIDIVDTAPLQTLNEGNGEGIVVRDRVAANYGNVGLNAVDLSFSDSTSSTFGATGENSFVSGVENIASGYSATATGVGTVSSSSFSNASNYQSQATGYASSASGSGTLASGSVSHSEGENTIASGDDSHAQNLNTTASGIAAHAEGEQTTASGDAAHAEGFQSRAIGKYSHAGGNNNDANAYCETSIGIYGTAPAGSATTWVGTDRLFNVGNGVNGGALSDAVTVLKNGLATLPSVTNALITAGSNKSIITKEYLNSVNDGSETKVTAGTNISVTGTGTIGSPYVVNSTYVAPTPDGSETKVTAGTNITVTGTGTIGSPYVINTIDLTSITAMLPVNRGSVGSLVGTLINIGSGSINDTYSVSGDIVSATLVDVTANSSSIRIVLANPMSSINYVVKTYLQGYSANIFVDNTAGAPVFKVINTTTFDLGLRETENVSQSIKLHLEVLNS